MDPEKQVALEIMQRNRGMTPEAALIIARQQLSGIASDQLNRPNGDMRIATGTTAAGGAGLGSVAGPLGAIGDGLAGLFNDSKPPASTGDKMGVLAGQQMGALKPIIGESGADAYTSGLMKGAVPGAYAQPGDGIEHPEAKQWAQLAAQQLRAMHGGFPEASGAYASGLTKSLFGGKPDEFGGRPMIPNAKSHGEIQQGREDIRQTRVARYHELSAAQHSGKAISDAERKWLEQVNAQLGKGQ